MEITLLPNFNVGSRRICGFIRPAPSSIDRLTSTKTILSLYLDKISASGSPVSQQVLFSSDVGNSGTRGPLRLSLSIGGSIQYDHGASAASRRSSVSGASGT
jgi:hypothetical protein